MCLPLPYPQSIAVVKIPVLPLERRHAPLDLPGIVITDRKPEPPIAEFAMARSFIMLHTEQYEEVKVSERRQVIWGVDLSRLADWLEEDRTGQRRLAL